jgi:hypothetical protein
MSGTAPVRVPGVLADRADSGRALRSDAPHAHQPPLTENVAMLASQVAANLYQGLRQAKRVAKRTTLYQTFERSLATTRATRVYQALRRVIAPMRRARSYQTVMHCWSLARYSEYRSRDRKARADFHRFRDERGGRGLHSDLRPRRTKPKTALIVSVTLPYVPIEAFAKKALQMAGFETVVLGNRRYDFLRYNWLARNKAVVELDDFDSRGDPEWVDRQVSTLRTLHDWLALEYKGVHVGRFVIALAQRRYRGRLDFADPRIREDLRVHLALSVRHTVAGARMMERIKPDCVLLMDRGYSGQGEIFDLALNRGIDTLTWNLGYKSDRLVFKRYNPGNERDHPLCPSADSWQQLCSIPWHPENGKQIRDELFSCYETQDWFSVVGTQHDKTILSREMTLRKLGLTPDKKVAVIFPHILWDGSFFFGKDLFSDYTHWFVETMKAAAANTRVQWVVKLHPAHLVKARQNNDAGRPLELDVIETAVGPVPDHIKLVYPDTDLSTYSLFQIADYAVTVRGTVGIESALFGVPVVTAGTGRYDRRGFTVDSVTPEEYLQRLATLETTPPLSAKQVELAERYAYGVFLGRPLTLASLALAYERDGKATPKVTVHHQTREQWLASPDMRKLVTWIADGKAEDMMELPANTL